MLFLVGGISYYQVKMKAKDFAVHFQNVKFVGLMTMVITSSWYNKLSSCLYFVYTSKDIMFQLLNSKFSFDTCYS